MTDQTYISSEDSELLRSAIRERRGEYFLEVGTGNAGAIKLASGRFSVSVGTDIARPTMTEWKGTADFVLADGASCFRPSTFDVVAFNPPYLPEDDLDRAVGGGRLLEVPKAFLRDSLRVVKRNGEVLFLLNNEAHPEEFERICAEHGFDLRRITSRRHFFESLTVYSAEAAD